MQATRILIVDDNTDFRHRLKEFLESERDFQLVGEAGDGCEAVEKTIELEPDVVIMDVRMPRMSGFDATRQLTVARPKVCVVMLSRFELQEYREAAMAMGASAYVAKKSLVDDLLPAIRASVGKKCRKADPRLSDLQPQAVQGGNMGNQKNKILI